MNEIFISYARSTNKDNALALKQRLGPAAFLDTEGIALGDRFSHVLVDTILDATIMVILADDTYFTREFCLWEYQIAQATLRGNTTEHIIVALPESGPSPGLLEKLLPFRDMNLPRANQTDAIATLVMHQLEQTTKSIGRTLGAARATFRSLMVEAATLPPRQPLAAPHNEIPPARNTPFVGRNSELHRLHAALMPQGIARAVWLKAPGGYGKTRLAEEYLHRLAATNFPDGIFWIDAMQDIDGQFRDILDILNPGQTDRQDDRSVTNRLGMALHEHRNRILFVVDRVPDYGDVKTVDTWCPAPDAVNILVTSRRTNRTDDAPVLVLLEPLASAPAVTLLRHDIPQAELISDATWERIATWVGELPLALELLNRVLRYGTLMPSELATAAEQQGPAKVLDEHHDAIADEDPGLRGATQAYLLSYQHLSPAAQRAIQCLAELSPAPIPSAFLQGFGPDRLPRAALSQLAARSFLTDAGRIGTVPMIGSVHRVLADFVRQQSTDPPAGIREARDAVLTILSHDAWPDKDTFRMFFESCLPHVEFVHDRMLNHLTKDFDIPDLERVQNVVRDVLNEYGIFDVRSDEPEQLDELNTRLEKFVPFNTLTKAAIAAVLLERFGWLPNDLHDATFELLTNLPTRDEDWAKTDAIDWESVRQKAQKAVTWRTKKLGKNNPNTIKAMNDLAVFEWMLHHIDESLSILDEILQITAEAVGPRHSNTTVAAWNFAKNAVIHMRRQNEASRLMRIFHAYKEHLSWLPQADDVTLSPVQQQVKRQVPPRPIPGRLGENLVD